MNTRLAWAAALTGFCMPAAQAATVSLSGLVVNSCVLSVPTTGLLVVESTGTTLRSDAGVGARPASLTVVAVGASPTLTFAAPLATAPSGATPDTVQYSYSASGSGANRGFASMDEERQREIASKGGRESPGNFANDREKASDAGRKGGQSRG